jgi:hypothetical protein
MPQAPESDNNTLNGLRAFSKSPLPPLASPLAPLATHSTNGYALMTYTLQPLEKAALPRHTCATRARLHGTLHTVRQCILLAHSSTHSCLFRWTSVRLPALVGCRTAWQSLAGAPRSAGGPTHGDRPLTRSTKLGVCTSLQISSHNLDEVNAKLVSEVSSPN